MLQIDDRRHRRDLSAVDRRDDGAGKYGTSSGTWIGEITGAGSPVIKVQCRNSDAIDLWEDYHTKALSVAILG